MEYNKAYLTKAGRIGAAEMKVLMIPSWYPTAEAPLLGTFYKEQAEALAARGVDMAVLYVNVSGDFHPAHNGIHRDDAGGVLTYTYVHPNLTPRWEKGRCIQRTRMLEKLYRRLEKEWGRPDVVNLRSSLQGYEAAALCRRHGLPLFFMEHSSYVVTEGPDSEAVRRLHAVMDAATVNACVSSVLYKVMAPYRETRIIPDFVDDSRFIIQETAPRETFTFRAMGQLRPIKGHDTLIRAFALLKKMTDRPVCLEIAGKGVLHDNLQKLIDQLGIADNCRLVGAIPRDEVVGFMNGCDCFVWSSRTEMRSCVLHECAACGRPAIATRCGGPQDIITEETGVLVPVDDPQAMAQAMLEMLDRAAGYDRERIRASILERFGIEPVCGQLIKACQDSAKGGK